MAHIYRTALVLLALVGGCAADDPSLRERIAGRWGYSAVPCSFAFVFERDGTYQWAMGCLLETGSTGVQREEGRYLLDGDTITLLPERATCPASEDSVFEVVSASGEALRLRIGAGEVQMRRSEPSDGQALLVTGCWDDDRTSFEARALGEL